MFPAYRSRYLPAMTARRIARLPDRAWAPVILATGAIEQHGPHLPVAVDSLLGQVWLTELLRLLPAEASCYVAPPITIGKSNEHVGFPGTLIISKDTLREQLLLIARQIADWGFRSLLILNTHGGNSAIIQTTLREIRANTGAHTGLRCALLGGDDLPDVSEQEATWGFHANEVETALLLAAAPSLVRPERAIRHYPGALGDPGELRPEFASATFSWASQDISPSGIMGDAPAGTAEKGRRWIKGIAAGQAAFVAAWCAEMRAHADSR
jgi:creatinine amidohydrolase